MFVFINNEDGILFIKAHLHSTENLTLLSVSFLEISVTFASTANVKKCKISPKLPNRTHVWLSYM